MVSRLLRSAVAVLAGLMMCVSFPPVGWWWAAVPALALLTWVLVDPMTTMAAVDRLVHHSIILEFDGETMRAPRHKEKGGG